MRFSLALGSALDIHLLWKQLPDTAYGYSVQIFDKNNQKVLNQDGVVHYQSALRQRVDLASLERGDYSVKLIVYNYETGAAVPRRRRQHGQALQS